MTAFFRFGTEAARDQIEANMPALVEITQRLQQRPNFLADRPLCIDAKLFADGEKQMKELRLAQGYSEIARGALPQANFLLNGIPIVCGD